MQIGQTFDEICKESAIKATTALSNFLHVPIGVHIKQVEIQQFIDINPLDPKEKTVNIYLPITGDITGACFFLYTRQSALSLCDMLFHRKLGKTKDFNEDEISALSEVANVVIGNFLTEFAKSLQMDYLMHRSAVFKCGNFQNSEGPNFPLLEEKLGEVVIKIAFDFEHVDIKGYVLIVFDEERIDSLMRNLSGIPLN